MDKQTLSNYGWIVICILVLSVMIAMATPFGKFIADGVKSTTQGLFDVSQKAFNNVGLGQLPEQSFEGHYSGNDAGEGNTPSTPDDDSDNTTPCSHTNTKLINKAEATCTTNGYTGDTYCNDCNTTTATGNSIPATGHQNTITINASTDYTGDTYCNDCNTTIATGETIQPAVMGCATFTDGTTLTWDELKLEENGAKYSYKASAITDTSIEDQAFFLCASLTSIDLSGCTSLTSIGYAAFAGCSALTSISLPDELAIIGNSSLTHCVSLTDIDLPESLTSIGENAFNGCTSLTSIGLPGNLTSIGNSAFYGCTALTSIDIPEGITSIGDYTFYICTLLTSVNLPESLANINYSAFSECTSLTSINYVGTMSDWDNIALGPAWKDNSAIKQIICNDGTITL